MAICTGRILAGVLFGMVLFGSLHAGAAGPPQSRLEPLKHNKTAFKEYMLNCGGCHRLDGAGIPRRGVPRFPDSIGFFTQIPAGREYLIRAPGSADSRLDNTELARVLNWIVATYSRPEQLPADFTPYTAAEIAAVRQNSYDDVAAVRRELEARLARKGFEVAEFLYGSNADFRAAAD